MALRESTFTECICKEKEKKTHFLILFYKVRVGSYLHQYCQKVFLAFTPRPFPRDDDDKSDGDDNDDDDDDDDNDDDDDT